MFCSKCGSPNGEAASFCEKCGNPMKAAAGAQGTGGAAAPDNATLRSPATPAHNTVTGKNPTVALVLSIFLGGLGVGQFYNGDWKKGLTMALATILLGVISGGLVPLGIWVWSMIDAHQVASGKWPTW